MPEEQNIIGNRWEDKVIEILTSLGWVQGGDKDIDIKSRRNKVYGIDMYFTYSDPYEGVNIGIFIEAKSRQWKSINKTFIEKTIYKLTTKIQEVPISPEFEEKLNFNIATKFNTGFILIWANDSKYDHEKFIGYLNEIELPKKRSIQRIFVGSNKEILYYCAIIEAIFQLKNESKDSNKEFKIFYPSLNKPKNLPERLNLIIPELLFSKFIFGKMQKMEKISNSSIARDVLVIFFKDNLDILSLNLMLDALINFQLLDEVSNVIVYCYKSISDFRGAIEQFKRNFLGKYENMKIEFRELIKISDVFTWRALND